MKIGKKAFYIVISIAAVVVLCSFFLPTHKNSTIGHIEIAGKTLKVDLAITPAEQEQGLSGRTGLAADQGMLFIFPNPGQYAFWMKDMNFPIDMIWFDQNLSVIYIKENAPPSSYPQTFGPAEDAKYVLEVDAGFSAENGLKIGDKMKLLP